MLTNENWIWLPREAYPDCQTTRINAFVEEDGNFTVAEFARTYLFSKRMERVEIRFSADTECRLYCNNAIIGTGPASVGGDFLGNDKPRPNYYAYECTLYPDSERLEFSAVVKMMPVLICEYSKGHGGFMLSGEVFFADGSRCEITTDETWQVRKIGAYTAPYCYDGRIQSDDYRPAEQTENIWHTATAPIPLRTEQEIFPMDNPVIRLAPLEEKRVILEFDKIHGGFVHITAKGEGVVFADIFCRETTEEGSHESVVLAGNEEYRGFALHSVGKYDVTLRNESAKALEITLGLIATYYPIEKTAVTVTSDEELNKVLQVCRHTLKYCRQTHHLDSPRHCEPLACTGDYYIETLMTAFSFGDMRLAEFDVIRTGELLKKNDGRMFHTTYSLIWVLMLHDVYLFTGHKALLEECREALDLLLNRFRTYMGENGLIETPPDYMFVDWIYIDGFSMHHPPKCLGQTCLNMFWFGALGTAARLYEILGDKEAGALCKKEQKCLGNAINTLLYDREKGLYFEGLNTPTPEHLLYRYMPQNGEKRYYLKHSNILAAYFGVCENAADILEKVMTDECPGEYQPYFAHFLLEAIYRNGLREAYTLQVLERWKKPVEKCDKGLMEGFIQPEPGYGFDHSHAWGGTPLYALPLALTGLTVEKPGMKELSLDVSLLGLERAHVEVPTPYGELVVDLERGKEPVVRCPEGVTVRLAG